MYKSIFQKVFLNQNLKINCWKLCEWFYFSEELFSLIVYFYPDMYAKVTLILNYIYCIPLQKECVSVHFGLRLFNNLAYLENFMKTPMRWHIWTARLDLRIKIHLKKGSQAKVLLFVSWCTAILLKLMIFKISSLHY